MNTLVVFFALASVTCGSLVPVAQPVHSSALLLDPHGRPLDTAEVINARALHLQAKALDGYYGYAAPAAVVAPIAHSVAVAPAVVAAPAAVSHQSRLDVISSPAVVSHSVAAPILAQATPLLAHAALGYAGHGHYLHKRSLGHYAYAVPAIVAAPAAVSHQSRVDVISSPAIVSHTIAAPVLAHATPLLAHSALGYAAHGHYLHKRSLGHYAYAAPAAVSHQSRVDVVSSPAVVSHAISAPVLAHAAPVVAVAPAAVSHQSRVDVRTSPAIVAHAAIAPVAHAAPVYSAYSPLVAAHGIDAYSHGAYSHLLKKRSLAHVVVPVVHSVPAAVSHQSRLDVISEPAVVSTHVSPAVYSAPAVYASPVVSHLTPIAHSAIWTAPHHLKAAYW